MFGVTFTPKDAWQSIRSVASTTPLQPAGMIGEQEILLKREDLGPTGSFKWRGALCVCDVLLRRGMTEVVTASTGNHGAAVAWAAMRLGVSAHIVVPVSASHLKCERIQGYGATLHRVGADLEEASREAHILATEHGMALFEDGGSNAQLMGVGTIASELMRSPIDAVVAPMACGALAGGIALGLAHHGRSAATVGVQVEAFSRLARVLGGGPDPGRAGGQTCADGLADNRLIEPALTACRKHLHRALVVEERDIVKATREFQSRWGLVVEAAAAAPLAALHHHSAEIPGQRVALIVSGANIDADLRARILGAAPRAGTGEAPPTASRD